MPIDTERKLAFCYVPRTGGVSICEALNLKAVEKHEPASWYRERYPSYYLFAVLRPYKDRIRSALGWRVPERHKNLGWTGTFEELVDDMAARPERRGLIVKPNEYFLDVPVDTVLRYETLEADLNEMLTGLGFAPVVLPRLNTFRQEAS